MTDISAFNPFRQGTNALTDTRNAIANSDGKDTALGRSAPKSTDPVSLSRQAQESQTGGQSAPVAKAGDLISPDNLGTDALASALEMIRGSMTEMFKLTGMSDDEASNATQTMFDDIQKSAGSSDKFDFSFKQAVASHTQQAIAYADGNSAAAGVSESAMVAMQSLDISINAKTGDFSFSYQASKMEVTRTQVSAIGNSMGAAMGAMGNALNGLGAGGLIDAMGNPANPGNGGVMFDPNGNGIAQFIQDLLEKTTGAQSDAGANADKDASGQTGAATGTQSAATQQAAAPSMSELLAQRTADLNAKLLGNAALVVNSATEGQAEDGSGDPILKLSGNLAFPLGQFGKDADGSAVFRKADGNTVGIAPNNGNDVTA
jgi:hypothetical protein